jgi:hypothetical protein
MAFTIPSFPLSVNVWRHGSGPPAVPALVTSGNLTTGRRVTTGPFHTLATGIDAIFRWLLLPAGSDVRGQWTATGTDVVECPAGTGRLYSVLDSEEVAYGFPNWHRIAQLVPISPFPNPPPPLPIPGPGPFFQRERNFPTSSDTLILTFTPGKYLVVAMTETVPPHPFPTLTSLVSGLIPVVFANSLAPIGSLNPILSGWVYTSVGGPDTLTIDLLASGSFMLKMYFLGPRTVDTLLTSNGILSPMSVTTFPIPVLPNDLVIAGFAGFDMSLPPTWLDGWPADPVFQQMATSGGPGFNLQMTFSSIFQTLPVSQTARCNGGGSPSLQWLSLIACYG